MGEPSLYLAGITVGLLALIMLIVFATSKSNSQRFSQHSSDEQSSDNEGNQESTPSGYILLELPDQLRSIFHDLLKGFEDFAKLKGYEVLFSIGNSINNKIAFKFNLKEGYEHVRNQDIRSDIYDYIDKVKKGYTFDDLPVIISYSEHLLISATLKNRLSFLSHNYELEKNARKFYEKILNTVSKSNFGVLPQSPIIFQAGDNNNLTQHLVSDSNGLIIGNNNQIKGSFKDLKIDRSISVRKEQSNKIKSIIKIFEKEASLLRNDKKNLIDCFRLLIENLEEKKPPNKSIIFRLLSKIKVGVEGLVLGHDATEAIKWIFSIFNFSPSRI